MLLGRNIFLRSVSGVRRASQQVQVQVGAKHHDLDVTFTDHKEAYRSKTNTDLLRAIFVYRICSLQFVVRNNKRIMDISRKILGRKLFSSIQRSTFYGHFVAGENQEEVMPIVVKNQKYGVKSILDYSVEKDVTESEAQEKVIEALEEVLDDTEQVIPSTKQFQTSLRFARRSDLVTSARTYYYSSEKQCDENQVIFMNCIDAVATTTSGAGLAAIKLTALGRPQLLLHLSEILTQMRCLYDLLRSDTHINHENPSLGKLDKLHFLRRLDALGLKLEKDEQHRWFTILDVTKDGEIDLLDWHNLLEVQVDLARVFRVRHIDDKSNTLIPLISPLTEEGVWELRNMLRRVNELAQYAKDTGVRIMIDAEQSYLQPAIRRITMEMMRKYNKDEAVVFNTYQCYLKAAMEDAVVDLALAERENFYFGAKLVRGAYMEQERARAKELGYPDPVCDSFQDTTVMYNRVLEHAFQCISSRRGQVAVMVATHNEDTVRHTVQLMKQWNVHPDERLICFGQLYGMCDHVSFALGQAGFSVYKYVPYGPVEEVLPYISRRAVENSGLLENVHKERQLLRKELWRRLMRK